MNTPRLSGLAFAVFSLTLLCGGVAQGDEIYYSVKGSKQGQFKTESLQKNTVGAAPVRMFQYAIVSPRDTVTGQATGKRQHKPIVITKLWGASSPQLYKAMVSNEILSEVIIDFYGTSARAGLRLSHSIKLTNANIAEISYKTEESSTKVLRQLETVSFVFQKIEYLDDTRTVTVTDDWSSPIN